MGFQKLYKLNWDESKATGYQLDHEYIPLLTCKKGREIISDVSISCFFTSRDIRFSFYKMKLKIETFGIMCSTRQSIRISTRRPRATTWLGPWWISQKSCGAESRRRTRGW